uniref:LRRNT domain-containing protein n=1 Tax=Strigops habroptila TaxID=2489341 RepID=A0A672UBF8_STRHB
MRQHIHGENGGQELGLVLLFSSSPCCPAACRCSMENVDCSEHGLREVPPGLATNTSALWLDYNFITVLGPRSFPPLPGLQVLSLPHNHLGLIHSQALVGLGALQELDLSDNYLTVLTPETFLPLTNLTKLNLGGNRLRQLEPGVLRVLPQLRALFLQDNPWGCSCSILPLWRWLSHNRDKVRGECPRTMSPSPPLHPAPCCQQLWAMAAPVSAWVSASLVCYLVPTLGPCAWRRGLGNVPATGTQCCPQQWHQPCHAEGQVCSQWAPLIFFCTFTGSVVVVYHNLRKEPHVSRRSCI